MELLLEALFELFFEGTLELSTNKKVPLFIRIILALIVTIFFLGVTVGITVLGYILFPKTLIGGLLIILLGLVMFIMSLIKLHELYLKKRI